MLVHVILKYMPSSDHVHIIIAKHTTYVELFQIALMRPIQRLDVSQSMVVQVCI